MQSLLTPQTLVLLVLAALLVLALVVKRLQQAGHGPKDHQRFGADHAQDVADMALRTRAEAQQEVYAPNGASATTRTGS